MRSHRRWLCVALSGTIAVTAAPATSTITATFIPRVTGTVAATVAGASSTITAARTVPGFTGTIAVTVAGATSSMSGLVVSPGRTGTIAVTVAGVSATFTGTRAVPAYTGTIAATLDNATALFNEGAANFPYPVGVASRKILDQHGAVWPIKEMAAWALGQNASNAEITTVVNGITAVGFNSIVVAPFGVDRPESSGHHPYTNKAGQAFTGTPFQSTLGAAWASIDHLMSEAVRTHLTVLLSLFVSSGGAGVAADIVAATNAQMRTFGSAVATRYAAYRNIVWHVEADSIWTASDPVGRRVDWYHRGIVDIEGSNRRLVAAKAAATMSSYDQFIAQEGTDPTGYEWLRVDLNTPLRTTFDDAVVASDDAYNEAGATSEAVWCDEPVYVHNPAYTGNQNQQIRERNYATFLRGLVGINFGNEYFWPAGGPGVFGGTVTAWTAELSDVTTVEAGYCWSLVDGFCTDSTWGPANFLLVAGAGSGDTKAAAGYTSNGKALAYFPDSRSVTVSTAFMSGNVRLRWFDPVTGTYATIVASESPSASRPVTYPTVATRTGGNVGTTDMVLVVDAAQTTNIFLGASPVTAIRYGTIPISSDDLNLGLAGVWGIRIGVRQRGYERSDLKWLTQPLRVSPSIRRSPKHGVIRCRLRSASCRPRCRRCRRRGHRHGLA